MVKRIAWTLALVGTIGVITFAAVALAGFEEFTGKLEKGGTVSFRLTIPDEGEQQKVKRWEWNNMKIRCRNGKHRYDGRFKGLELPVDRTDRSFFARAENPYGGRAILRGSFDKTFSSATGTFRIRGRTSVGRRCRGERAWTAYGPPE